jgi:hypothetical protein
MYGDGRFSARKRYLPGALARLDPEASTPMFYLIEGIPHLQKNNEGGLTDEEYPE